MPPSGRSASSATSRSGVRQWGKMFVIRRFCIKTEMTEMKNSAKKRERTRIKRKRREECVCVCDQV